MNKVKSVIVSLVLVASFISSPSIFADEVILKKGKTLTGTIISLDKASVKIETEYGTLDIPRSDIEYACIGSCVDASGDVTPTVETGSEESAGLIAAYRFSGNAEDSSPNQAHGSLSGGLGFSDDRFGQQNQALICQGKKSQYLKIEDHPEQHFKKFTLSAWVSGNNPKLWARIVDKYIYNQKKGYALIYNHKQKTIALDAWTTDKKSLWIQTKSRLSIDWQHICVTYDGSELRIYYNGTLEAHQKIEKSIQHTDRYLSIGNGYDGSNHFPWNGKIDDVLIFNKALSEDDVMQLYTEKPDNSKQPADSSAVDLKNRDSI